MTCIDMMHGSWKSITIKSQKAIQKQDKQTPEAESKEKHGLLDPLDPMPELTLSPLQSRLQHICKSRLYPSIMDYGFGLKQCYGPDPH